MNSTVTLSLNPFLKSVRKAACLAACVFLTSTGAFAQFTAGNLVVLQAGDGSTALANTGNQIILKEFTPLGASGFSVAISPSVNPLIISGSASSEGGLSLSPNGKYLVFTGYATNLPYSSSLANASSSVANRGIGIVDAAGGYTRAAVSNTFHSGNNIRAAVSDGLDNYWSAGANDGTDYFGTTSTTVTVQNANVNSKGINIFGGNLYFSTGSGSTGIYQVGTGLPMTSGQTNSVIIGTGSGSPFEFVFNSAMTICYIADDRSIASGGGIQKWINVAGTWSLSYTLGTGVGSTVGARGVVADFSGNNPVVYATTAESTLDRLISITDAGSGSAATTLATASANTIFRGLAFSPTCSNPQITAMNNNGPLCAGQTLSLNPTITGTGPFTYTWSGPASYTSASQSPTLTASQAGNYSLSIANTCGSSSSSTSITVNQLPNLSVNSATICSGGSVTLTANGASTYTWSTASNSSSISVSPSTNTTYVVMGTSALNCSTSVTSSVELTSAPAITVNSATVCLGTTATLTASGVSTYSWSSGSTNTAVVNVTPSSTTIYTVSGNAAGCGVLVTNTAVVTVNALPLLSVTASTVCAGKTATLGVSGANTYLWNTSATGSLISVTPLITTVYTVSGTSTLNCINAVTVAVTVNALPIVSLAPLSAAYCSTNGSVTLSGTPAGGVYSGTGVSGNAFSPAVALVGTYTLAYTYTDLNGCVNSDTKSVAVTICTGLQNLSLENALTIYPNPCAEKLFVNLEQFEGLSTVAIYNLNGQKIMAQQGEGLLTIDVVAYPKGIYYLQVQNTGSRITAKFVKD